MESKAKLSTRVHFTVFNKDYNVKHPNIYTTPQWRRHTRRSVFMAKVLQENMQPQSAGISFSETRGAPDFQHQRSGRRADGHTFEYGDGETNKHNSNYPPSPTERGETQLLSKINKPSCMAWKTNRVIGVGVCVRRKMQSQLTSRIKRKKGGGEEGK